MSIIVALLNETPFIIFPVSWVGWIAFIVWLGVISIFLRQWQKFQVPWTTKKWILFFVLVIFVPITSIFIGVRLPAGNALPLPDVAMEPQGRALMALSALPWMLAAGLLGPLPAAVLAALSGILLAILDTHTLFTLIEAATLALLLGAALQQNYRTWLFRGLRHPLISGILLSLLYPVIFVINALFVAGGSMAGQIDYAITHTGAAVVSFGGPLLIAGLFGEIVMFAFPGVWGGQPPWEFAPAERSLEARFFRNTFPLAFILIIALMVGDWIVAGNAAEKILENQMASVAEVAAEGVPYFLDTGQSLILQLAGDPNLDLDSPAELASTLDTSLRTIPFFNQLFVLDDEGKSVGGHPVEDFGLVETTLEEQKGIELALTGVPVQSYPLPSLEGNETARITFIAPIMNERGSVLGVLIGRTDLGTNPIVQPVLASLKSMKGADGKDSGNGYLLDEENQILFNADPNQMAFPIANIPMEDGSMFDSTAPDGTRQLTYYQSTKGRPWSVLLTIPARQAQQLALNIAAPLLGMVFVLGIVAVLIIRVSLQMVTSSLKTLAIESDRIAKGQLDHSLPAEGEDEVGQLRRSFEQMRVSLKARLDELNRLLLVSQGVAASLEIESAVQPILESAAATGACSARIALEPSVIPEASNDPTRSTRFGLGKNTENYSFYDDQLLAIMREQDRIVLTNPARTTLLNFAPGTPRPEALLAVALRHETQYYGTLWIGYDTPHTFTNEEVRFLITLAGQAALAAANAQLFLTAEFGRQRLAAILASTPDPVLVTDYKDQLLLVNPVAWQALGMGVDSPIGKHVNQVIKKPELVKLLRTSVEDVKSSEVSLPDGRVYLATASSIVAEGQRIGRVCVLRDITHFKELDALKSEFVSTVSHDLRSPLTLMRGYATMLEMVGDLNEQQSGYVRKIVVGVESMSRLINNLLDLGRIEADIGLQLEMLSVLDIVEEVTEALRLQATQKRIQLHVEVPETTIPLIEADRALLQQALYNLVENAIKYTSERKDVWVRINTKQDRMILEVEDTGIGISPVDQPRLFERFYRSANREAKKERGTGLGLAIVKSIAERHNGRVWVESQLGKGSAFFFEIPIKQKMPHNVVSKNLP
jgi:PAS domain S-box-containing protein